MALPIPNSYTVSNLLASLKRRGFFPTTSDGVQSADFVGLLNEELQTYIMALIIGVREEHHVYDYDVTVVAGQDTYDLPYRATGDKLKQVLLSDQQGGQFRPLVRVEPERQYHYAVTGTATGYVLKNDSVQILPAPYSGGQVLRLQYFQRPGTLVMEDQVGQIATINTGTNTVTVVSSTGLAPVGFVQGALYDFQKGTPSFKNYTIDQACTALSTDIGGITSMTFGALPTGLAVGDFVCPATYAAIPQITPELHPLLAQRAAVKTLEALGDAKITIAKAMLDEMRAQAMTLLTPRVEGSARVFINYNGPGWRRNRYRR